MRQDRYKTKHLGTGQSRGIKMLLVHWEMLFTFSIRRSLKVFLEGCGLSPCSDTALRQAFALEKWHIFSMLQNSWGKGRAEDSRENTNAGNKVPTTYETESKSRNPEIH